MPNEPPFPSGPSCDSAQGACRATVNVETKAIVTNRKSDVGSDACDMHRETPQSLLLLENQAGVVQAGVGSEILPPLESSSLLKTLPLLPAVETRRAQAPAEVCNASTHLASLTTPGLVAQAPMAPPNAPKVACLQLPSQSPSPETGAATELTILAPQPQHHTSVARAGFLAQNHDTDDPTTPREGCLDRHGVNYQQNGRKR